MFFKHFILSAVVGLVTTLLTALAFLPNYSASESRVVTFASDPPSASATSAPVGALEAARAYAHEHDHSDCVDPAHARLDDVILTFPSEPRAEAVVTPVGFDEALRSGEFGRWNVLACRAADRTS